MTEGRGGMLRLGGREFGDRESLVLAVVDGPGHPVDAAVDAGADAVELPDAAAVAAVRAARPELVLAVRVAGAEAAEAACGAGADLLAGPRGPLETLYAAVAARHGAGVVCAPRDVAAALAAGVRPGAVVVDAGAGSSREAARRTADAAAAGHPVLVDLAGPADGGAPESGAPESGAPAVGAPEGGAPDGAALVGPALATAAVTAWLGARVFRVRDAVTARQALDMVASIAGHRPPAKALRGMG